MVAGVGATAAASAVAVALTTRTWSGAMHGADRWVWAAVLVVLMGLLAAPALRYSFSERPEPRTAAWVTIPARLGALVAAVAAWTTLLSWPEPGAVWLLGVMAGSEAVLTAWSRGGRLDALALWTSFERSSAHLGVTAASVSLVALDPGHLVTVAEVYGSIQLVVAVTAATAGLWQRLHARVRVDMSAASAQLMERHQSDLADWLHDDVCTPLNMLRARLATGVTPSILEAELAELDHKLRIRQLDERLAVGPVRLSEVIQPYVRLAADRGIQVTELPSWDEASHEVGPEQARLVRRALAVAVPNALRAGAREIALRVRVESGADRTPSRTPGRTSVTIEVDDDAGGLDPAGVPAGRGLDGLRRQVTDVAIMPIPGGTRVRVVVPATPRRTSDGGTE